VHPLKSFALRSCASIPAVKWFLFIGLFLLIPLASDAPAIYRDAFHLLLRERDRQDACINPMPITAARRQLTPPTSAK
jgi:hypothetical protein